MGDSNNSSKTDVSTLPSDRNSIASTGVVDIAGKADDLLEGGSIIVDKGEAETLTEIDIEPPIEAGLVSEANKDLPFHKEKHQADTSRKLAFGLLIILGVTVIVHYLATLILELNEKHAAVESIEKIFNSWLPVISGLVGGAVTYYFTKDK